MLGGFFNQGGSFGGGWNRGVFPERRNGDRVGVGGGRFLHQQVETGVPVL